MALYIVGIWIVVMEALFAWWMYHPVRLPVFLRPSFAYYYDYFQEDLLQFDARYATYNKDFFYTLDPESHFSFGNIEFNNTYSTNNLGLRGVNSTLIAPEVACVGDSYTMGWGVEQDQSFPSRLAALSGLKVANMGMASYGTAREIKELGRIDTSHLRWLIIQYCCNDQDENRTSVEHGYKLPISSRDTYERLVRAAKSSRIYFPGKYFLIIGNYFIKSRINLIYRLFSLRWDRKDWGKDQEGQARTFLNILYNSPIDFDKMRVVITIMDDADNMRGPFLNIVRRLSTAPPYCTKFKTALLFLDAGALLTSDDRYILDVHLKASGHEKIAQALLDMMKKEAPRE
jgi:lysophospholipase L1-like esterase